MPPSSRPRGRATRRKRCASVKLGDPSRRVSVTLPLTLREFQSRVVQLFGVGKTFSLWLDPGSQGRAPGRGRVRVVSEADYCRIADNDVIVLTVDGREVDPNELCRSSTMQLDFRPWPYVKEKPRKRDPALDASNAQFWGESTHKRDFLEPPPNHPRTKAAKPRERTIVPRKFTTTTTYGDDFIAHPIVVSARREPEEARAKSAPFTHVSSYAMDYGGNHKSFIAPKPFIPSDKQRSSFTANGGSMISTYQAEYPEHSVSDLPRMRKNTAPVFSTPFSGRSTYERDYTEKKINRSRTVHLEPQATMKNKPA